jgi:hypothetical protein
MKRCACVSARTSRLVFKKQNISLNSAPRIRLDAALENPTGGTMKQHDDDAGAGPQTRNAGAKIRDTLSQAGAMHLARRLEKFWHDRDFPAARFWAEPITERFAKVGTYEIYRVVCNLVNGLPPRYRNERP